MPSEITGLKLKVGDIVVMARSSLRLDRKNRELGTMRGEIIRFNPKGGSGSGKKTGSARVKWTSGYEGFHDAAMLVKVDP